MFPYKVPFSIMIEGVIFPCIHVGNFILFGIEKEDFGSFRVQNIVLSLQNFAFPLKRQITVYFKLKKEDYKML